MYIHPEFFALVAVFTVKHFIADYPLQNSYMLRKFAPGWAWVMPLAAHAGVHFLLTAVILGAFSILAHVSGMGNITWQEVLALASLDFALHFVMDRIKASPMLLGKFKTLSAKEMQKALTGLRSHKQNVRFAARRELKNNTYFWWSLGFDQMIHHLTDITVVYLALTWGLK